MLGRTIDVLLEKPGRRPGQLVGRSPWLQAVHVDAPETLIGIDRFGHYRADRSEYLFGALPGTERAQQLRKGRRLTRMEASA